MHRHFWRSHEHHIRDGFGGRHMHGFHGRGRHGPGRVVFAVGSLEQAREA